MAVDIENVVVLMLENRSFDHMLGLFPNPAQSGLLDATGAMGLFKNPLVAQGANRDIPARAGADYVVSTEQIDTKGFGGPAHSFPAATLQVYGAKVAPSPPPATAPLDGFVQSYYNQLVHDVHLANPTDNQIATPMTAFQAHQLPVLWQLAEEFCVCDHWFSEVPGPTQPNRLFVHAGTAEGFTHNVWSRPFASRTIYEELDKAGRDWGVFYFDLRDTDSYHQISKRVDRIQQFDQFFIRAKQGSLPSYSFLCPRFNEAKTLADPPPNSQHAPYDVRNGENLIADVYEALRASPLWAKTLLVITYDEHGGYFDHVPPPAAGVAPPDGFRSPTDDDKAAAAKSPSQAFLLEPQQAFGFDRLGVRVPALLVSPWAPRGSVVTRRLQHTSIFATLHDLFGTSTLTARGAQAASFADALSLAAARDDTPEKLNRPPLATAATLESLGAPLTEQQSDMWGLLALLDGHAQSGEPPPQPKTRAQAYDYIQERLAAHEAFNRARRRKADYQVYRDASGKYGWRLLNETGEAIAASPGLLATPQAVDAQIAQIRDLGPFARQTDPA